MNDDYLLDKKNSRLLLVKDYLKEYYINKGFSLLPKNKIFRFFSVSSVILSTAELRAGSVCSKLMI